MLKHAYLNVVGIVKDSTRDEPLVVKMSSSKILPDNF